MTLKERFSKAIQKKARRGFVGYPVATIAYYGPNDKTATKVAVSIVPGEDEEPTSLQRWFSNAIDARRNIEIDEEILKLIRAHEVKSVAMVDRIIGCPHEEGVDYPEGEKCPQCPFWAHRDRWTGENEQ